MTMANTAYVCKVNVNKIEIVQPDVVAELIELIKAKVDVPTSVQLGFQRNRYRETLSLIFMNDLFQPCSVLFDISLDHIEVNLKLETHPYHSIHLQVRDYFDAICVAHTLKTHFNLDELEIHPQAKNVEGKIGLA